MAHFDLVSHWQLAAPPPRVWAALSRPEQWPAWWPYVRRVQTLAEGQPGGVGRVRRIEWATRLPYRLCLDVEATEVLPGERLRGRSRGTLDGEGLWLLQPLDGGTLVTYLWRVRLDRAWMRWAAPLLAPLFRWNHEAVMRAGGRGLALWLAQGSAPAGAALSPPR